MAISVLENSVSWCLSGISLAVKPCRFFKKMFIIKPHGKAKDAGSMLVMVGSSNMGSSYKRTDVLTCKKEAHMHATLLSYSSSSLYLAIYEKMSPYLGEWFLSVESF